MNIVISIISLLVGLLLFGGICKIVVKIINDIKRCNQLDTKYKVSFNKHFNKVKVPLIKMKIAGQLKYFVVDSGADNSVLSKSFYDSTSKQFFTDLHYSQRILTPTGESTEQPFVETSLSYKKDIFEDIPFIVADLSTVENYVYDTAKISIAGILGSAFFNKYKWAIDFDERCVWVASQNKNIKNE